MKKRVILILLLALVSGLLLVACAGGSNIKEGYIENMTAGQSGEATEIATPSDTEATIERAEHTEEKVTADEPYEKWYVKEGSVQTVFSFGEKFNYYGIVAIYEKNGDVTEYTEDDIYIDEEPIFNSPGVYEVEIEIIPTEVEVTYEVIVKDIDVASVSVASPTMKIEGSGEYRYEVENIDFNSIMKNGEVFVTDSYADGGVYVQNYGVIGNCFGFKVDCTTEFEGATITLRMANFAVTMIYPAEDIAIYQNYISIDDNTKLEIDPMLYLTTRAPSTEGQEGADTTLVWCDVIIENITLCKGENSFIFVIIGDNAPYFDSITITAP